MGVLLVVGELLAMADGGAQGAAGVGDAPSAQGPRRLVEPPVTSGQAIVGLGGQEVQLCIHVFHCAQGV
jgi:hypothetical protein